MAIFTFASVCLGASICVGACACTSRVRGGEEVET